MSTNESQVENAESQASKKIKLVLKTSPSIPPTEPQNDRLSKDGSSSPPRPSYSPVTPTRTASHDKLTDKAKAEPEWMDEPQPLSLNLDDNTDAIALKATLSLLQMQRQQSLKDIRDLDKLRDLALDDPHAFAQDLQAGKLKKPMPHEMTFDDVEYEDDEDDNENAASSQSGGKSSKFGQLPNAQNIARCPPIEWSKYHILGKPLEEMHERQKKNPGVAVNDFAGGEHEIAAPYRPFKDNIQVKKESR